MKQKGMKVLGANANINDVTEAAISIYDALVEDDIAFRRAKEMSNALGKIISSVKLQIEYAELRRESPEIAFMKSRKGA